MQRMSPEPRTVKDLVEADLRRAARLMIAVQDEIDPQLRIATPDGDYWLGVTLPAAADERAAMLRRLATFMAWKQALAFTLACETFEPAAVYCVGIAPRERHACLARIERAPRPWTEKNFAGVEWLAPASIDPVIADLLPRAPRPMTPKEISALEKWFGVSGQFPAVHIPTGEVRGI